MAQNADKSAGAIKETAPQSSGVGGGFVSFGIAFFVVIVLMGVIVAFSTEPELTPQEQQAAYEEALLDDIWFLCDDEGAGCKRTGARVDSFDPLTLRYQYDEGAKTHTSTLMLDGATCPGTWRLPTKDESYDFCLRQESQELYQGWIETDNGRNPLCLSFGRDVKERGASTAELKYPPSECVSFFTRVERNEIVLSNIQ